MTKIGFRHAKNYRTITHILVFYFLLLVIFFILEEWTRMAEEEERRLTLRERGVLMLALMIEKGKGVIFVC